MRWSCALARLPRLLAPDQHSRGVFRVYRTTIEGDTMRFWRDAPGFSQRLEAKLSDRRGLQPCDRGLHGER